MLRFPDKTVNNYSKNLQDKKSKVCGYYCLAFIYMRIHERLNQYFQIFNEDKTMNDKKIVHFVRKLIKYRK